MAYGPKNSDYGSGSNIIQCQYVQSVHGYQVSVVPPGALVQTFFTGLFGHRVQRI